MSSSSVITQQVQGLATATSPGLVGTGAQTWAGDKTLNGLLTAGGGIINTGLTGANATTVVTAGSGKVGEFVTATTNQITSTANSYTIVWNNSTTALLLSSGVWHIFYYDSTYRVGLTGSSPSGYAHFRIFNSTDSLSVSELTFFHFSGAADAEAALANSGSFSYVVNITSSKTFYGQIGASVNSGSTAAFSTRGLGKFFAVRII